MLKIVILLTALFVAFGLQLGINWLTAKVYDRDYPDAAKGVSSTHYIMTPVPVNGVVDTQFGQHDNIPYDDANPNAASYDGMVYFDAKKKIIKIKVSEYNPPSNRGVWTKILTLDLSGKVIGETKFTSKNIEADFVDAVLLPEELKPFQPWTDQSQPLYLKHFKKEKLSISNLLNPFAGMGNPTGGNPHKYWRGQGYYDVKMNGDLLKFKLPAESRALFFSEDYDYDTGVNLVHLPAENGKNSDTAFVIYTKNHEPSQVYLIKKK